MNSDEDDRRVGLHLIYDRFFRQRRKCRDGINASLHLGKHFVDVDFARYFYRNSSGSFISSGVDLDNSLDVLDRLFHFDDDALLDLQGRGTQVRHLHLNQVQFKVWCGLLANRGNRYQTGNYDEPHQQICRDMIASKPCNETFLAASNSFLHR